MRTWPVRTGRNFGRPQGPPQFHAFQSIDANKDQKISKDELLAQFAKVDADKDGQVTRAEMMKTMMTAFANPRGGMKGPHPRKPGDRRPDAKKVEKRKEDKQPETKPDSAKKPEAEAPKSEKPPEAKPAESKPADTKSSEVPREKVEPVVVEKPQVTSSTPVEAVRPRFSAGTGEQAATKEGSAPQPEPPALPSA